MKRTPIERKTPIRRSGSLPRVTHLRGRSRKRASQEGEYTKLRATFLAEHRFCAACGAPSQDLHHSAGRDGWRLTYVPWFVALCRSCHDWCGANPVAAIAAGYSRKRHGETT